MKKLIKTGLYSAAWLAIAWTAGIQNTFAGGLKFGAEDENVTKIGWTGWDLVTDVTWIISKFAWFLMIIAIVLWIYGWFEIMSAAWDDKKVAKWKTIITQAVIWLIVIFLASSIVQFVITTILWAQWPSTWATS